MKRGINLRGFEIELEDYSTVRGAGPVLFALMRESVWHDMKLVKYFAARGKLTSVDVFHHDGWTALTCAASVGHLDILKD